MQQDSQNDARNHASVASELTEGIRQAREQLRDLLARIDAHVEDQHQHARATEDVDEMQRLQDADPFRWLADAKHALQSGVMFAERAVTQPTSF